MARRPPPRLATPLGPRRRGQAGAPGADDGTDPYLLWAEATGFRGFGASAASKDPDGGMAWRLISCVAELDLAALRKAERASRPRRPWHQILHHEVGLWTTTACLDIPRRSDGSQPQQAYVTLTVPTSRVLALQAMPFVRRVLLSLPRRGHPDDLRPPARARRERISGRAGGPARPVMAVIDDGFPLLHPQFADAAGRPRWRWFWDQDMGVAAPASPQPAAASASAWRQPANFGYGRELTPRALAECAKHLRAAGAASDAGALYAALRYPARPQPGRDARTAEPAGAWPLPRSLHGALCAGLAAGRGSQPGLDGEHDAAAQAELIFVQLPSETVADTSGGGLATYVLDALRYILARTHPQAPLVVNLSYGAAAGPHDGSSVLELALEQLLAERKDFAIVVPAGNLRPGSDARSESRRLHAEVTLAPGEPAELQWELPPGSLGEQYLELWPVIDGAEGGEGGEGGEGAAPASWSVSLVPPAGPAIAPQRPGQSCFVRNDAGQVSHGVIHCRRSPLGLGAAGQACLQGDATRPVGAPMALLAVAPTGGDAAGAPFGRWRVRLCNEGPRALTLHAWIERCDATFGGGGRQSFFAQGEPAVSARHTLGSLSHGPGPVVVGGLVGASGEVASYSASGPALGHCARIGPDFSAVCEQNAEQPWLLLPACRPGDWVRANGTSLAAPVVARQLLNLLAREPGHKFDADGLRARLAAQLGPPGGARGPLPDAAERVLRGPRVDLPAPAAAAALTTLPAATS